MFFEITSSNPEIFTSNMDWLVNVIRERRYGFQVLEVFQRGLCAQFYTLACGDLTLVRDTRPLLTVNEKE